MSIAQTTTLPSISHLLNSHPPAPPRPPRLQTAPAFNLSPASPVSSHPPSPPPSLVSSIHSPCQSNADLLHPLSVGGSSPLLSPIDSCKSPLTANASLSPRSLPAAAASVVDDLPPLQGYDPPVRKLSSPGNTLLPPPQVAPWSSRDTHLSPPTTTIVLPVPSSPIPTAPRNSRSNSTCSSSSSNTSASNNNTAAPLLPSPTTSPRQEKRQSSTTRSARHQQPSTPAPPSTQIIISPSGQPILKRRRGRPPSNREPQQEGGWTFLTPTVWDVKQPSRSHHPPADGAPCSSGNTPAAPSLSSSGAPAASSEEMHGSMAAFTSSTMETVLQMPRKKRGRKPKTHIEGNSCFVWRDLPCTRSAPRSSKKTKRSD